MAENAEFFGLDGTQPLPTPPVLPDPLSGLVTGSTFTDPVDILGPVTAPPPPPPVTAAAGQRRRTSATTARTRTSGATTPTAIPVAASLPTRPVRRPTTPPATRTTPVPPVRAGSGRSTTTPRRSGGIGCGVIVLILVLIVIVFIVLGALTHTGGGGFTGG